MGFFSLSLDETIERVCKRLLEFKSFRKTIDSDSLREREELALNVKYIALLFGCDVAGPELNFEDVLDWLLDYIKIVTADQPRLYVETAYGDIDDSSPWIETMD